MKIGIMQPYFFPYIGYFQLIHAVDRFVFYDDVNFIKQGWINRNYVLAQGRANLLTLPLSGASSNRLINDISIISAHEKILKTIRQNYGKAPSFSDVFPVLEKIMRFETENLAVFLIQAIKKVCSYLGFERDWLISSSLDKNVSLRGQDKVLAICEELGASQYINAPGGAALYDREEFAKRGIELSFIRPRSVPYRQYGNEFVQNLSIVDVMMFNSQAECRAMLGSYDLV